MAKTADVEVRVRWLPYQLAPQSAEEPSSRVEAYMKKFGRTREQVNQMAEGMKAKFQAVGLDYSTDDPRIANTKEAHRIIALAYKEGGAAAQDKAAEALFHGYFAEGRAPNEPALLELAAKAAGLDESVVTDRSVGLEELEKELQDGRGFVTSGVPHFMISPEGGRPVAEFAGAQPVEEMMAAIVKASR